MAGVFRKVFLKLWRPFGVLLDSLPDRRYGVETGGYVPLPRTLPAGHDGKDCVWYQPTPWAVARAAIQALCIRHHEFCFVDYGSGKGRVLLAASEFPFRRVLGVELSPVLHTIASRNIAAWIGRNRHKVVPESICVDARDFPLPREALVAFMFTPFKGALFEAVIRRLADPGRNGLPTIVVYYGSNITCLHALRGLGWHERRLSAHRNPLDLTRYSVHYFSNQVNSLPAQRRHGS